jgi:hypothetical protein
LPTLCFLFFSHRTFFKNNFMPARKWHIWLCPYPQADPSQSQKSHFFATAPIKTTKPFKQNLTLICDIHFLIITIFSSKIFS